MWGVVALLGFILLWVYYFWVWHRCVLWEKTGTTDYFVMNIITSCISSTFTCAFVIRLTWPTSFHYACHLWNRNVEFNFPLPGRERLLEHIGGLQHWSTADSRDNHHCPQQQQHLKSTHNKPGSWAGIFCCGHATDISQSASMQPGDAEVCVYL